MSQKTQTESANTSSRLMSPDQNDRWISASRQPVRFFQTVNEELSAGNDFWRSRAPNERMEYREFMRCVIFGEEVVSAKMARCYGWRKLNEEADPQNVVYF